MGARSLRPSPPGYPDLRSTNADRPRQQPQLQHLVELSEGDRCAGLEQQIEAWLESHDVVYAGSTIPFVLMPHFVSPGQLRRVRRVHSLSAVLDRFW